MGDISTTRILLVSANVGSIFEDPENTLKLWLREFLKCLRRLEPRFLAMHCQEVGGKNYEDSMQHVNNFVTTLLGCEELQNYDRVRVFLDEDFTAADKFTALGNLYFVHEEVDVAEIWDFEASKFFTVEGREVQSGNIENVSVKEKAKFPQHFYPDFKWSRKGFLRTRWNINNCHFDLCNIHLFHDASNIIAMQNSPSIYCGNRQQALRHTLQRFESDKYEKLPMFIFGDFNFRLDSHLLIQEITDKSVPKQTKGKKDQVSKIVYTEEENEKVVLTVESKLFNYHDKHSEFFNNKNNWLQQFDTELNAFKDQITEFDISFPPSYPFSEDTNDGLSYMKTRCPSWCDRVLYNHKAKDIMFHDDDHPYEYEVIGHNTCMGDHKPVYLLLYIKNGTGKTALPSPTRTSRWNTLSVNGEDMSDVEIDQLNIHDYAIFEREQELEPDFRVSIRSRSFPENHYPKIDSSTNLVEKPRVSFHDIAKQVISVESVLMRWPRPSRHHSSSSEESTETSLEDVTMCHTRIDQPSILTLISADFCSSNSLQSHLPDTHALGQDTIVNPSGGMGDDVDTNRFGVKHVVHSVVQVDNEYACDVEPFSAGEVDGRVLVKEPSPLQESSLEKNSSWKCPFCTLV